MSSEGAIAAEEKLCEELEEGIVLSLVWNFGFGYHFSDLFQFILTGMPTPHSGVTRFYTFNTFTNEAILEISHRK